MGAIGGEGGKGGRKGDWRLRQRTGAGEAGAGNGTLGTGAADAVGQGVLRVGS